MYEDIAWKHFCKTGSLESFFEYKKILELNNNNKIRENNDVTDNNLIDNYIIPEGKGDVFSELNKNKGSSN